MNNDRILNKNQKVLILAVFTTIIILSSILTFSLTVFVMQLLLGFITIPLILKKNYNTAKLYITIFIISILFVFLVYLANQLHYGQPYYIGGSDDLKFEQWGVDLYYANIYNPSKILETQIIGQYHNSPFFVVYISVILKFSDFFGGYSTFIPRIVNVYFLLWICMILEYILTKYANLSKRKTMFTITGFSLMPNIQYVNSHVFRDTFNLLQIFLIVLLFDQIMTRKNLIFKLICIALFPILIYTTYYTRTNSLAFASVILFLIVGEHFKIKKRYMFLILIPLIMMSNILDVVRLRYFIDRYSSYVSNIVGDGLSGYVFNRPLLPLGVLFRAFYAFITPFPDFFGLFKESSKILFDFVQLLIYLGVLVQILALPFIIKRLTKIDWLSLSFISWFGAIIITTFTFRHIIFYYPFMVAVAVDGYLTTACKNRKIILLLSGFTGVCFGAIYVSIKLFS